MQLLGYPISPFVRHALIVLEETGIECDFKTIDTHDAGKLSPTKKVPLLIDGDLTLSDSTTICRYLREKAGQPFLKDIRQHDTYCMINTLMDSTINTFLYERYGFSADTLNNNGYVQRQQARVNEGLDFLEELNLQRTNMDIDSYWRLACYLSWGVFRERISLDNQPQLTALLAEASTIPAFEKTLPQKFA